MVAAVISKVLSVKLGTVLIAALAANAIDALPAVAEPKRLVHVLVSESRSGHQDGSSSVRGSPAKLAHFTRAHQRVFRKREVAGGAVRLSRRREGSARKNLLENYTTVGTHLDDEDQNVAGTFASAARSSLGLMGKAKGRPK
jgi:hypothetical protein